MLRNLLITTENGRILTTYGVKRSEIYTMKFTFLTFVILIYGSVFVCGDLEIYPGIQQEETYNNRDDSNDFFEQFYLDPRWRASIPWDNRNDQEYYKPSQYIESELSARVRQFVNSRREQLINEAKKNPHFNIRLPEGREGDRDYHKAPLSSYERYRLKYPNQQILDDVRPYPHEENDFSFRDNEEGEDEQEQVYQEGDEVVERAPQEASGRGALSDIKTVNDPTDFAYAPPDPRFYEDVFVNPNIQKNVVKNPRSNLNIKSTTDGKDQFYISQRTDGKFPLDPYQEKLLDNTVEVVAVRPHMHEVESAGVYIIAIVAGISAAATVGLIAFAIGWYKSKANV